jgi:beta-glucanase (GH16 family)
MTISKGSDTLSLQISLTSAGVALGAIPGLVQSWQSLGQPGGGVPFSVNLAIFLAGVVSAILLFIVHWRAKTFPDRIMAEILARHNKEAQEG